jgi:hypothetical protein
MKGNQGAVAFEKMRQPLNMEKADSLRQDRVIQSIDSLLLVFCAQ